MAITLRTDQSVELTYQEADENFSSLFYSASISGNTLSLYYTGSQFAPSINPVNIPIPEGSKWTGSLSGIRRESDVQVTGSLAVTGAVTGSTAQITNIPVGTTESKVVVVDDQGNTRYRTDLSLQGPIGVTGAQGTTGSTGAQGTSGTNGAQGTSGTNGAQGATGAQGTSGASAITGYSLASSGYQIFSNGLIIQWGFKTTIGSGTVTFPIAFPTSCTAVTVSTDRTSPGSSGYNHAGNVTNSSFYAVLDNAGGRWIAVGY